MCLYRIDFEIRLLSNIFTICWHFFITLSFWRKVCFFPSVFFLILNETTLAVVPYLFTLLDTLRRTDVCVFKVLEASSFCQWSVTCKYCNWYPLKMAMHLHIMFTAHFKCSPTTTKKAGSASKTLTYLLNVLKWNCIVDLTRKWLYYSASILRGNSHQLLCYSLLYLKPFGFYDPVRLFLLYLSTLGWQSFCFNAKCWTV